jgi:hypothetical protein
MSRGKRGLLGTVAVGLTAMWGVALAEAAPWHTNAGSAGSTHVYMVSYSGTGSYTAKTEASVACGLESRNETTHFSWLAQYRLSLAFNHGFGSAGDSVQPDAIPGDDNTSTVAFSGCAGTAACHGDSQPAPGNKAALKVPAAASGGRSTWLVGGVGYDGFKPEDFSGTWNAGDPGSCASWASSGTLIDEEFNISAELQARFPVKYATLKSLPRGHYFKVHISPGHYAQPKVQFCQPSDGCESETFDWTGVVRVKRVS